jgi:tetratricopeptide (TPR) repeat protein
MLKKQASQQVALAPFPQRYPSNTMKEFPMPKRKWLWAGYKVISNNLKWYLDNPDESELDESSKSHIARRMAINLYYAGDYAEAWPRFERVCSEERSYWIPTEIISNSNINAARCSQEMYFITRDNTYLNYAYHYYQMGIETMKFDLYAMFRLPQVLEEYGRIMEHYGAFQAGMETYTKALTKFPNYRGYFTVLYRTTIIGKYIAEYSEAVKRDEFYGQCIDTLQFLLEALPKGIDDVIFTLCVKYAI